MTNTRTPSAVDAVAEAHARALIERSPALRVELGVPGDPHALDDYSPAAAQELDELNAATLARLDAAEAEAGAGLDDVDRVTLDAMRERLGVERELHAAGLSAGALNVIHSPVQNIRDLFDLVPTATAQDWADSAGKLRSVPQALAGYREALTARLDAGRAPAIRQVTAVVDQARAAGEDGGHFDRFIAGAARADGGTGVSAELAEQLRAAAVQAKDAYADIADFLESEVASRAVAADAVGREAYALYSREFLGAAVDLDETYAWGLAELARIDAEQQALAAELYGPGTGVHEAIDRLEADPDYRIEGLDGLRSWMQAKADDAIERLAGSHLDIPDRLRTIECMVLPEGTGGIYYTGPTEDFSRPGRMWWSVPAGVESFSAWQELTTVYHEGVPGHHLQVGEAVCRTDTLNTWRRSLCWVSGHGEGWALYAERLMADLGFLDDPGFRMGMLDSQRLRAARVVVDLGVHLGLEAPAELGGGTWDAQQAWEFLTANVAMDRSFLAFELDRYLGWPGQAPSYKIGQRLWEEIRDGARAAAQDRGEEFDLKAFHSRALALGSVGLDTLRRALS